MSIHSTGLGDGERLVVRPRLACLMLDVGVTRLYQLLAAGELESFRDDGSRKITVQSIKNYVDRRLAQAPGFSPGPATPERKGRRQATSNTDQAG